MTILEAKGTRGWVGNLFRSVAARVVAFSTVWAVLALVVISTVIASLYRDVSERGFQSLLSAHLFNLIGSVGVSENGVLTGSPDLGDLRFAEPRSGWYWSVEPVGGGMIGERRSLSMTAAIPAPPESEVPFDSGFTRTYRAKGLNGEDLQVLENEFVLDSQDRVARFRVMGNHSELESEIDDFERQLLTYLGIFGFGMIAINAFAILLGLRPLIKVRAALATVREGTASRLDGRFPTEIEPLVSETNALIDSNRRIVERARTQVGNLAHSLKTPLAVLLNEGRQIGGEKGQLISDQSSAMQRQVEYYLQRARMAAQRETTVFRTPVTTSIARMGRVIEKLYPDITLETVLPPEEVLFAGEREDLEELAGNLLENGAKWGRKRLRVSVTPIRDIPGEGRFELVIEDDGPGIPDEKTREALIRGRRLDETKPGSGLGLAIVTELVKEYAGELSLARSDLGGLKATVRLRSVD
ncbi:ATP-binding protein [Mesorhizobium sp. RP14(2022)]|uniref:histidine kinase n=1 Tax=Mesorhizobium liriopis TaxID=2953882 RepID=A0ABT1C1E7_9HYPH|nr:ATP-binding protein [Mesorhizobium liriopis]MCO6048649.1 ATP-binding protein [Mesorhizobium liriopis]